MTGGGQCAWWARLIGSNYEITGHQTQKKSNRPLQDLRYIHYKYKPCLLYNELVK